MSERKKQLSFDDLRTNSEWGGRRSGAGRKRAYEKPPVHHVRRDPAPGKYPSHVRLSVLRGIPSLRKRSFVREFRRTVRQAAERGDFRVVHYSIQRTHVHLIVEAAGKEALARGMKAVGSRLARAVHRVFGVRGKVLFGRYWVRALRTPREVRNALSYVLLNARKHFSEARGRAPRVLLDVCSSGAWFEGWKHPPPGARPPEQNIEPIAHGRTWLLARGWRRCGLIDPSEIPGRASIAR